MILVRPENLSRRSTLLNTTDCELTQMLESSSPSVDLLRVRASPSSDQQHSAHLSLLGACSGHSNDSRAPPCHTPRRKGCGG